MNRQTQGYDWNQGNGVFDDHDHHSDSGLYDQTAETESSSQSHHGNQEAAVAHAQYFTIKSIDLMTINKKLLEATDDDEIITILESTRALLTSPHEQRLDDINSDDIIKNLLNCMKKSDNPEIQLAAARTLQKVVISRGIISVATIDKVTSVAVPILLKLLSSSRTDIAIQVLQAIEKAEDDEDFGYSADLCSKGYASLIGDIIKIDEPVALLRAATAAIKNHLSNSDLYIVPYVKFQGLVPKLLQLLQLDDIEILANVCHAVIALMYHDDYAIILEEITRSEGRIIFRLFSLLSSNSSTILIPAMHLLIKLINIRTNIGGKQLAQILIDMKLFQRLSTLLQHPHAPVKSTATAMVESFRCWDRETFLNMLDDEILIPILRNFRHNEYNVKTAVAILSNYIIKVKSVEKFAKLLEYGVIEVGCNLLLSSNREHLHDGLRLMYCISMRAGKEKMEYAAQVRIKSMKGALYKLKELRAPNSFITREVTVEILKRLKIE